MSWDLALVCPSGVQLTQLSSAVRAVAAPDSDPLRHHRIVAITGSADAIGPPAVEIVRVRPNSTPRKPSPHFIGRVLRRLGPADDGARFLRAVLADDAAREALDGARVIAALERDGIWTAWRWSRRRPGVDVVLGLTAGLHRLETTDR